ncbi:hypothetical protein GCM10010278_68060 [Streptomyces melanogenes]|nr:hypothetical protein GCM10010278_68060 [Streptomyces melanogenes]
MRAGLAEEQVGARGAGEDAVDREVADLLEVAEVHRDGEGRDGGGKGAVPGEQPPPGDLYPLPGEQQDGGERAGAAALEGEQLAGRGGVRAVVGVVEAVRLAQQEAAGEQG